MENEVSPEMQKIYHNIAHDVFMKYYKSSSNIKDPSERVNLAVDISARFLAIALLLIKPEHREEALDILLPDMRDSIIENIKNCEFQTKAENSN